MEPYAYFGGLLLLFEFQNFIVSMKSLNFITNNDDNVSKVIVCLF